MKMFKEGKMGRLKRLLSLFLAVVLLLGTVAAVSAQDEGGQASESAPVMAAAEESLTEEETETETETEKDETDKETEKAQDPLSEQEEDAYSEEAPAADEELPNETVYEPEQPAEDVTAVMSDTAPEIAGGIFAGEEEIAAEEMLPGAAEGETPENQDPAQEDQDPAQEDQGQTQADQGQTQEDQGQTQADQGQTQTDQGQTQADQGQTPANQGQTPADQGQTPAVDEEITLTVKIVWPEQPNQDQPIPMMLDAALFFKSRYEATMAANSMTGDMLNYYPFNMPGYITRITLKSDSEKPDSNWQGSVTLKRSELPDVKADQKLVDYVKENLVWKEERPLGYVYQGSTVSDDGLMTTISNRVETAVTARTVSIVWDDHEDTLGLRPESVTVKLNSGQSVTLSKANNWTGVVGQLPFYVNDTRYEYEWVEPEVQDYAASQIDIEETGTIFTLTCLIRTEMKEVEVDQKYYKLTIRYFDGSTRLFDDYVGVYAAGDQYNVKSPAKAGYIADKERVTGTIKKNTKVTVKYTPQNYRLTIRYATTDGKLVAQTYSAQVRAGSTYEVDSPEVDGYTAQTETAEGTMPGKDTEIVVYYTRDATESSASRSTAARTSSGQASGSGSSQTAANTAPQRSTEQGSETESEASTEVSGEREFEDYETPLGLGMVSINAGDCLE